MEDQRRLINGSVCCLPNCRAKKRQERDLSFHRFPSAKKYVINNDEAGVHHRKDIRALWIEAVKMQGIPGIGLKVCSKHFKDDEFFQCVGESVKIRPYLI